MKKPKIVRRRGGQDKVIKPGSRTKLSGTLAKEPIGSRIMSPEYALNIGYIDAHKKRHRKRYKPAKQGGVVSEKDKEKSTPYEFCGINGSLRRR